MSTSEGFGYLKANTVLFAHKMSQSLNDMCGAHFLISKESLREGSFSTPYSIILFAGFSGAIQGNYIISLDDTVAVKLINAGSAAAFPQWESEIRREYTGLLKEALNTAVGQAIEELGKCFNDLAYSPITAVFGEIEFPPITSASIIIEGKEGKILCSFAINLANLKIGEKLEEVLGELERRSHDAKEFNQFADSALSLLAAGFVVIDENGIILNGSSRSSAAIAGLPLTTTICGRMLPEIIGIPEHIHPEWKRWISTVFCANSQTTYATTAASHAPFEFTNIHGRQLKLTGSFGGGTGDNRQARQLIVIEDVSRRPKT